MNPNFTTLIATTLQNFSNKIMDNVILNNATLYFMKKAENIKIVSGGRQFVEQLLWRTNSSFGARASLDPIPTPVTDPLSASQWNIKVISGSIVLPTLDVAMNAGSKEQLIDYARTKSVEAETSMSNVLGAQLMNTNVTSVDFDSIPRIIANVPTAQTDVGGIDSSTSANAAWRNYVYTTAVSAFNTSQNGLNAIDTSLNASTFGRMGPKLMVTTKAIFTLYQLSLTPNVRYTPDMAMGNVGFKALQYATIPIVFDDNCPAQRLYGIDTEAIKLKMLGQGNFKQTPFQMKFDQLAEAALLYVFGNLTCDQRRTSFVITTISG